MGIIRNFVFNEGLLSSKQEALLLKCLGEVQQAEPSEAWDLAKVRINFHIAKVDVRYRALYLKYGISHGNLHQHGLQHSCKL